MSSYPCEKCDELVPENEYCGNDRPDGSSEYLCPDCYRAPIKPGDTVKTVTRGAIDSHYHSVLNLN